MMLSFFKFQRYKIVSPLPSFLTSCNATTAASTTAMLLLDLLKILLILKEGCISWLTTESMMSKPITTTNHPLHHIDYHYRHWNILSQIWSPLTVLSSLPFSRHHQNATTIPWFLDGFFYNHLVNVALYEKHQPISTCMSMPTLS